MDRPSASDDDAHQTVIALDSTPDADATRLPSAAVSSGGSQASVSGTSLTPGQAFGTRYTIRRLLGAGGMGAVYQAWDAELGVSVALKTIRTDVSADPEAAASLGQRFKRELLLAREVTHRNVVRIYDLGDVGGTKYISMSYVDGENIAAILTRRGKLPVPEALGLARQIAAGLEAAHEAGVIHRDLKPANIMVDSDGHALIMDFGLARQGAAPASDADAAKKPRTVSSAVGLGGETTLGTILGTAQYMAPEQATGEAVDHRADIYAFGLILRDMLLGLRPIVNPLADLLQRTKSGLPGIRTVEATIPEPVDALVARCLEIDPAARYASMTEVCAELARLDDEGNPLPEQRRLTWRLIAAVVGIAVMAIAGGVWLLRPTPPPPAHEPVSVLVADFDNRTGDPEFSGTLEQAMGNGLERASFVTVYPRTDARTLLADMSPQSAGKITTQNGQLLARREGIKVLVAGAIEGGDGAGYRVAARLLDPGDAKVLASAERRVSAKNDVLKAIGEIARVARAALGESTSEMGKAETFTASSLGAVREYTIAQDLQDNYKDQEAAAHYELAVRADPKFGRAYAGWAHSAWRLGQTAKSDELWKKALSLIELMTEREKYRTLGLYYGTVTRNYEKAIENYATLVRLYPADDAGHNNLALSYFSIRNFQKALEEGRIALGLYPRQPLYRSNAALFAMYAGDFASAAGEAGRLLKDKRDYFPAYLPLAIAALAQGKPDAARDFYRQMAKTGAEGASVAATGLADVALYEGRNADAVQLLKAGIVQDAKTQNQADASIKWVALSEAYVAMGRTSEALRATREGLRISRSEEIAFPAARVLIAAGAGPEAATLSQELGAQLEPNRRAYGKLIEAELAVSKRQFADGLEALRAAQKLADVWLGRFALGRLYLEAKRDAEAVSEFDLCRKRSGEATSVFLNDRPTYRYLATVPYWLARAQEGLGLTSAAQANFRLFLTTRTGAPNDPLVTDARRRFQH
ncbi:MAG: protein kinase domain-containing protein [Bacteroidales bacterium]